MRVGNFFSTEDMSFEFKKAFAKATELRSLTFSQQWTMTDESIFTTETPVSMALFNVPPGITEIWSCESPHTQDRLSLQLLNC